jgi:hypothetical protein
LTLRKEHRLRVFENRVLRRTFGPKWNEVKPGSRKLHSEELQDLYSLPSIFRIIKSRRMGWVGHIVRMGVEEGVYVIGRRAREKETTRRTKTEVSRSY